MAVSAVIQKMVGEQLLEWIYLGVRTGMRAGVADYRRLTTAGQTANAQLAIERAVDLPHRARARVNQAITTYGLTPITNAVLAANSNVTVAEVNAELTSLETYATGLVNHRLNDAWTWNQIATDIETNVVNEIDQWVFPLPSGYLDVWGK